MNLKRHADRSAPAAADLQASAEVAATVVALAQELSRELFPARQARRTDLDASLDRDWGFDSLSRAELLLRVERTFRISLPEKLLGEAGTLRDILDALPAAERDRVRDGPQLRPIAPAGAEAAPDAVDTLTGVLDWHAERHAEHGHLIIEGEGAGDHLSYGELAQGARQVARGLRRFGVSPGDRIAIMLPTGRDFFLAFFGSLYAGTVPVPVYPPARATQIAEHLRRQAGILRNAGAIVLIADEVAKPLARLMRMQVPSVRSIQTIRELFEPGTGALPKATATETAVIQYTSGSTGDPKGVVLSHANLIANIRAMGAVIRPTADDVFVSWLPLYHDMGLIGAWLGSLHYGAPLVVMSPLRFLVRPEAWLWAVHRHRGTLSAAPNFAFELCIRKIEDAAIEGLDLGSLRMVANGAEAVSPATIRRFSERFGRYGFRPEAMAPVYGLAENAVGLTFPPLGRAPVIDRVDRSRLSREGRAVPARPGTTGAAEFVGCGRALPGHQIRIVGATGELGERQEGRLQFCGPSATSGYFENRDKDRELFEGSWLNSGDLAYIAAGEVFITGRSKDIIIRAGQHIYPQEVEEAVGEVPGIRKGCVAVIGAADPRTGTEGLVVVAETREADAGKLEGLRAKAGEAAARLLQAPPEEILLVPPHAVPKTSSGKIRRAAARQLYERGEFAKRHRGVRMQIVSLALSGALSALCRWQRTALELAYAGYWWAMVGLFAAVTWPLILALRGGAIRWAVMHRLSRALLAALAIPVSARLPAKWPGRTVLASNHSSYIDGLVLSAALPGELTFVAKQELAAQRIAGPFLRALGTIFVERNDPAASLEGEKSVFDAVRSGRRVIMFPEGTFERAPGLLPFRMGAFTIAARASVPVIPIAISGARSILRGSQWFPRRGPVTITVGEAIAPTGSDFAAAVRLRDQSRAAVLRGCGEPEVFES